MKPQAGSSGVREDPKPPGDSVGDGARVMRIWYSWQALWLCVALFIWELGLVLWFQGSPQWESKLFREFVQLASKRWKWYAAGCLAIFLLFPDSPLSLSRNGSQGRFPFSPRAVFHLICKGHNISGMRSGPHPTPAYSDIQCQWISPFRGRELQPWPIPLTNKTGVGILSQDSSSDAHIFRVSMSRKSHRP